MNIEIESDTIFNKLNNATLTKEEFKLLPYLERKIYQDTAKKRFSKLDSHLSPEHIDWKIRVRANNDLSLVLNDCLKKNLLKLKRVEKINLIEIGFSLGASTTLFVLRELTKTSEFIKK
ncbi:MAG: hypothetical protein V1845_03725 [bacterium]